MKLPAQHRRAAFIGLTALALVVPAGVAVARALPGAASGAAPGITAAFASTASWDGGYSGAYTVRNAGSRAHRGWTLEFDLPPGARITSVWEGEASARTGHVALTPAAWNAELVPGGSATVGFVVTHPVGANGRPTGCLLDGGPCTGGSPTATTTPGGSTSGTIAPVTRTTNPSAPTTTAPTTTAPTTTAPTTTAPTSTAPTTTAPTSTARTTSTVATTGRPVTTTSSATSEPPATGAGPGAALGACPHFSAEVPPSRTPGAPRDAASQAGRIDLGDHLPPPASVTGSLTGGSVKLALARVAGAAAYRVWRNGQPVAWVDDWGQASLTVTDPNPCRGAYYTVAALRSDAGAASTGRLSTPFRLGDDGMLRAAPLAVGTAMTLTVTAYGDQGQTASGLAAGSGICAVDARRIPWGTRLKVDGYGYCYAADIGTWIQGDIVDVWLPDPEAVVWGVQTRTVTVVAA